MGRMVVDESSVLPKQNGTLKPHSYTTNSDHTYCYILETNNPQDFEKRNDTFQKEKLRRYAFLGGLVLCTAVVAVVLCVVLIPNKRGTVVTESTRGSTATESTSNTDTPVTMVTGSSTREPTTYFSEKTDQTQAPTPAFKDNIHCVFVAELYNFGHNQTNYDKECALIWHIANYFMELKTSSSGGLWTYGYKNKLTYKEFKEVFDHMKKSWAEFALQAKEDLQVNPEGSECRPPGGNKKAIEIVSETEPRGDANCLIFFSGMNEEQLVKVPGGVRIEPNGYKSVVVVGLRDTNLTRIVDLGKKGYTLLNVPLDFTQDHVEKIMEAIRKGFEIL